MTERDDGNDDTVCQQVPSQAVIKAVAAAEDVPPEELRPPAYEPLYAVVDPEALDSLFSPQSDGSRRPNGEISFPFCGYTVTVTGDGAVTLTERTDQSE